MIYGYDDNMINNNVVRNKQRNKNSFTSNILNANQRILIALHSQQWEVTD